MNKSEIIDELVANFGYKKAELKTCKVDELKQMLTAAESVLNTVEVDDVNYNSMEESAETIPDITDLEWTDYVIRQMDDKKELDNGMPKCDGLRRVAMKLLGMFDIRTDVLQRPTVENAFMATVAVELRFHRDKRIVMSSANVYSGNTDSTFAKHAVSTAETRAEGRALRKALNLTRILTAEEMYSADADEPDGSGVMITTGIMNGIKVMADMHGIDLFKLCLYQKYDIERVEELTNKQGLEITKVIGDWQRNKDEQEIPKQVLK